MNLLLAATAATQQVQTVVQKVPVVVEKTVTQVQQVPLMPENILNLAQLLGMMGTGFLFSVMQTVINRLFGKDTEAGRKLASNLNRFLQAFYSTAAGFAYALLVGDMQFDLNNLVEFLTAFVMVLGSSGGTHEFAKWVNTVGPVSSPQQPDTQVAPATGPGSVTQPETAPDFLAE